MSTLRAVIEGRSYFMARLTAAALQKAAFEKGAPFSYEIAPPRAGTASGGGAAAGYGTAGGGGGAAGYAAADAGAAALGQRDFFILVGSVQPPDSFAGRQAVAFSFEEVLDNPALCVERALSGDGNTAGYAAAGEGGGGTAADAGGGNTAGYTAADEGGSGGKKIVAVTSCPTGIAHTFMAAEGLEQGARALGHQIQVETQGSTGGEQTLTAEDIAGADVVIIAADRQIDLSRFAGKMLFACGTNPAIIDGQALIQKALARASPFQPA